MERKKFEVSISGTVEIEAESASHARQDVLNMIAEEMRDDIDLDVEEMDDDHDGEN